MATVLLSPNAKQQFLDNAGAPAAGFKLHTYAAGTTNPQATYLDRAGLSANANPIILDARGEAIIYLTPGVMYDYALTTGADVPVWTRANVSADAGDADAVSFQQVGTGAVTRTAQGKMRDVVSVADFGAVSDGVTDSTDALTAAILAADGKELLFEQGTYLISGALPLNSNYHWRGKNTVVKMADNLGANIPGVLLNLNYGGAFSNISISGITFDSNRDNNVDHGTPDGDGNQSSAWVGKHIATAIIANVTGLSITNCRFINSWGNGVLLNNCKNVIIDGCTFDSIRRVALAIQNPDTQFVRVVGCHFARTVVGCMIIDGGHDIAVVGNTAELCSDRQRFPAIGYSGTYPNIYPSSGGFKASGVGGYVSGAQSGDGSGIEVTGSTSTPLYAAYGLTISANAVTACWVGIRVEGQNFEVSVAGNSCRACEGPGIFLFSSQRTSVVGNVCEGNLVGIQSLQGPGTPTPQRPRFNNYTANVCHNNSQYGMQLGGEANSNVAGNIFSANGGGTGIQGGISLIVAETVSCQLNSFSGNQISNNNWLGIGFDGTTHNGNLFTGNLFSANVLAGMHQPVAGYPESSNKVTNNVGYATAGFGTAQVNSGSTSVVVNHGLGITPDAGRLSLTPVTDTAGKRFWIDYTTITSTQFTVRIDSTHGAGIIFNWLCSEDA